MADDDLATLALYNTERSRGLVHDVQWQREMAQLQAQFDEERKPRLVARIEQPNQQGRGWLQWLMQRA